MFLQDWQIYALVTSLFTAIYIHVNHMFQLCGLTLVLLRGLLMLVILSPFMWFFPVPQTVWFYAFGFGAGLSVVVGDKFLLAAAAKYGGRLTSLFISLKIFLVFVAWNILNPTQFHALLERPYLLPGLAVCYAVMVVAMLGLRRQDTSAAALLAVIPAAAALGAADIFTKIGLAAADVYHANIFIGLGQFLFVSQMACVVGSALWLSPQLVRRSKHVFSKKHWYGAVCLVVPFLFLISGFLMALNAAPNPAYVGAITVLCTVWLTLYYKLVKGDDASIGASMLLVAAAMGLTLLTA